MEVLVPLGGNRLLSGKKLRNIKRQEAGWYQEYRLTDSIRIVFLPAKHYGRRGLNDTNKTLWGTFLIIANDTKIFFGGDTAYDEQMFKDVRNLFGDIDICLLPIGAYSPQWVFSDEHINPEEAVQIFKDLGGRHLIPMHYGTFDLSYEPISEPLTRLLKSDLADKIKVLTVGEEFLIEWLSNTAPVLSHLQCENSMSYLIKKAK
jgi:L-ascorbate metabolism protein UlaG (beta-lactamase superfamily)